MIFKDQTGRNIFIKENPKKIISLVPSITELLFDLGLEHEIYGITEYCIHPKEKVQTKTKIGGPKNINIALILSKNPDLIIASKEENEKQQVESLMEYSNVYVCDIKSLNDAITMIRDVGIITNKKEKAENIIRNIKNNFGSLKISPSKRKSVAYLIWENPYMTINNDTFINHMLFLGGFENVFAYKKDRYPKISLQEIRAHNPDFIFLSTEPYLFTDIHVNQFKEAFPNTNIKLVNGEIFSWYGSHLIKVPDYFKHLL
ncbi:MAG: ABC transporter substrate-binding protein [Thiohalospira sp.]